MKLEQRKDKVKKIVAALNSCMWYDDEDILTSLSSERKSIKMQKAISKIRELNPILKEHYGENYHMKIYMSIEAIEEEDGDGEMQNTGAYGIELISIAIIIHYPEIELTNKNAIKHTIRDLFLQIVMMPHKTTGELVAIRIEGMRTTVTPEEYIKGYRHSHLHAGAEKFVEPTPTQFCIGTGELSKLFTLINGDRNMESDMFILLLHTLNTFVAWESLDGGPFIRVEEIKGILPIEYDCISTKACNGFYKSLKRHKRLNQVEANLNFKFENDKYVVVIDDLFENYIMYLGTESHSNYAYTCIIAENGQMYKITFNYSEAECRNIPDWKYSFRGKEFPFTIIDAEIKLTNFSVYPKIKDYVKQQIEQSINRSALEKGINASVTSTANAN
jgi:hypothetical protein